MPAQDRLLLVSERRLPVTGSIVVVTFIYCEEIRSNYVLSVILKRPLLWALTRHFADVVTQPRVADVLSFR